MTIPKLEPGIFFGETAGKIALPHFSFTEKKYSVHQKLPSHSHRLSHYCLVLSGHYQETILSKEQDRNPSTLLFHPAEASHSERHHTEGRHFLIEIESEKMELIHDSGSFPKGPVVLISETASSIANRLYHEFRRRDDFFRLSLEGLTLELLAETCRATARKGDSNPPAWLRDIKDFLRTAFGETLTLDALSKMAGVHPVHLARTFRRFEKCTIGDFVRKLRIDFAKSKLQSGGESLTEIALAAGFSDHTHFTKSFKRATGITPSEYRFYFQRR